MNQLSDQAGFGGELGNQLEVLDKAKQEDDIGDFMTKGVDLNSCVDVFYAILKQIESTPQEMSFLTLLQHLLQLDAKEESSDLAWELAEKLVCKAKFLESREEAEKLLRLHSSSSKNSLLTDKRRGEQRCCCSCHLGKSPKSDTNAASNFADSIRKASESLSPPSSSRPTPAKVPNPPPAPPLPNGFHPLKDPSAAATPPPPPPLPSQSLALKAGKNPLDSATASGGSAGDSLKLLSRTRNSSESGPALQKLPQQNLPQPKSKLRNFAWNKVPVSKVLRGQDNIWAIAAQRLSPSNGSAAISLNFDKLEEWFAQDNAAHGGAGAVNSSHSKRNSMAYGSLERRRKTEPSEINLLDPKRSLNINIFLKQFRRGVDNLLSMITAGQSAEIGLEKLKGLMKILPELDEIETLNSYAGSRIKFGEAERFFLSLIDVPNYRLRIECMLLREEFTSVIDYIKPSIDAIIIAAKDVKNSKELQEVVFIVLMAGNYLNSGSYSGNAAGFKVTSLAKLFEVRSNKPRATLLHFVAMEAEKTNPNLLHFPQDFRHLEDASRLSIETIRQDIQHLREKTDKIGKQIAQTSDTDILSQMTHFLDFAKEELVGLERDLAEIETLRLDLANFFCEDLASFKLEECFKTFHSFSQGFSKAVEENQERRVQEEKAEIRRRLKEQQTLKRQTRSDALPTSHSAWSIPTATGREIQDEITLTHYFQDDTATKVVSADGLEDFDRTRGRSRRGLEERSGEASLLNYLIDSESQETFSRGQMQTFRRSANFSNRRRSVGGVNHWISDNERERSVSGSRGWRDRVNELMRPEVDTEVRLNRGSSVESAVPSSGCEPIFSKKLENSRSNTQIANSVYDLPSSESSSDNAVTIVSAQSLADVRSLKHASSTATLLAAASTSSVTNGEPLMSPAWGLSIDKPDSSRGSCPPMSTAAHFGSTGAALDSVKAGSRGRRSRSMLMINDQRSPADLDDILDSCLERQERVIGRRVRGSVGRKAAGSDMEFDEPSAATPATTYEEVVQHCEKSKQEIDEYGLSGEEKHRLRINPGQTSWRNQNGKSLRDSGIDDSTSNSVPSPPQRIFVPRALPQPVEDRDSPPSEEAVPDGTEVSVDYTFNPVAAESYSFQPVVANISEARNSWLFTPIASSTSTSSASIQNGLSDKAAPPLVPDRSYEPTSQNGASGPLDSNARDGNESGPERDEGFDETGSHSTVASTEPAMLHSSTRSKTIADSPSKVACRTEADRRLRTESSGRGLVKKLVNNIARKPPNSTSKSASQGNPSESTAKSLTSPRTAPATRTDSRTKSTTAAKTSMRRLPPNSRPTPGVQKSPSSSTTASARSVCSLKDSVDSVRTVTNSRVARGSVTRQASNSSSSGKTTPSAPARQSWSKPASTSPSSGPDPESKTVAKQRTTAMRVRKKETVASKGSSSSDSERESTPRPKAPSRKNTSPTDKRWERLHSPPKTKALVQSSPSSQAKLVANVVGGASKNKSTSATIVGFGSGSAGRNPFGASSSKSFACRVKLPVR